MNKAVELPVPGDLFQGKYRIQRLLGKGGMGAVFAADHVDLGTRVAVKFLLAEAAANEEANARFKQEARAAAQIHNDHVARVVDVSIEGGLPFMVMEYLEGQDLSQLLEDRTTVPPEEACGFLLQACDAIHAAHAAGIIHRDLKPSNLFLATRPDGSQIVKVLDFGISKAQNGLGPMSGALTSTKAMLGSPLYMSPEQLRSSKSVDARADIWALGVILYELLTGSVPYNGENLGELFASILEQDPLPVRQRAPHVAPELEAVVMRCLQRQASARYSSVAELAFCLAPFAPAYAHLPVVTMGRGKQHSGAFHPGTSPSAAGYTQPIGQSQAGYLPQQGPATGGQAPMQYPQQHPQGGYRPPQASVPAFASNTGNPVNVPVAATAVLGAGGFRPQNGSQSGGELFQDASSVAGVPSRSSSGMILGIGAFLAIVAIGIGTYTFVVKKSPGASTSSTPSASAAPSAPPTPSLVATAPATVPVATDAPSATVAVVTPPQTPVTAPTGHGNVKPPASSAKKPPTVPVTPPTTPPTTPPVVPTAKPTSTLQTSR